MDTYEERERKRERERDTKRESERERERKRERSARVGVSNIAMHYTTPRKGQEGSALTGVLVISTHFGLRAEITFQDGVPIIKVERLTKPRL